MGSLPSDVLGKARFHTVMSITDHWWSHSAEAFSQNRQSYRTQRPSWHSRDVCTIRFWYPSRSGVRSGWEQWMTAVNTVKHCTHSTILVTSWNFWLLAGWSLARLTGESRRFGDSSPISTNKPSWILWTSLTGTGGRKLLNITGGESLLLSDRLGWLLVVGGKQAVCVSSSLIWGTCCSWRPVGNRFKAKGRITVVRIMPWVWL